MNNGRAFKHRFARELQNQVQTHLRYLQPHRAHLKHTTILDTFLSHARELSLNQRLHGLDLVWQVWLASRLVEEWASCLALIRLELHTALSHASVAVCSDILLQYCQHVDWSYSGLCKRVSCPNNARIGGNSGSSTCSGPLQTTRHGTHSPCSRPLQTSRCGTHLVGRETFQLISTPVCSNMVKSAATQEERGAWRGEKFGQASFLVWT